MTTKARLLAARLASGGTFTATITKRDGTRRQIRFRIPKAPTIRFAGVDRSPRIQVDDLDAREPRTVRLDAVHHLTEAPAEAEADEFNPEEMTLDEISACFG